MYLLFDIGASKIRLSLSKELQNFSIPQVIPTPKEFQEAIIAIKQTAFSLAKNQSLLAAAGGVRALDKKKERLVDHPHIPLWSNQPLKQALEKQLSTIVYLENDAVMAALGEATHGAGLGSKTVVYITIGSGVGGAKVVGGKIKEDSNIEPGRILVEDQNLESLISGTALEQKYGQKGENIKDQKVWEEVTQKLAKGLSEIIKMHSPEIIILGGSVINSISMEQLKSYLKGSGQLPKLRKSQLGEFNTLYGAMEYLKVHLNSGILG